VDAAQLLVGVIGGTEISERRLDPVQAREVTAGQHVDECHVSLYQMLLAY